ncbi:serine/threonine-protein kinase RsbT [Humibacillus xanthopallidus]|uniref:Serine/threonine-protein kinase RsbT n=1 Tax=Humibacillus xanthopallidus TaxID=412689 RepID=A0A543PT64_9MICO|nr:sigma-70 family RNA polymerase sigma factor [Humibacillus xanthopallidus]TQN47259.1 serine/threonine-protein kinase RsbT [Humibacillus xanthopallidus]
MTRPQSADGADATASAGPLQEADDLTELQAIVRRVVGARVGTHPAAEDLVQETLTRVLAAAPSVDPGLLEPYAIVTAKNLVASMWRDDARKRRNQHRAADLRVPESPEAQALLGEERSAMASALGRLDEHERALLIEHELRGTDTRTIAEEEGTTPGAVAARLSRSRARLRVEYVLGLESGDPPTDRCRPVLLALSAADRRRQRELDAATHLFSCDFCGRLSEPLLARGQRQDGVLRIPVAADPDIVKARGSARELAGRLGFSRTDLTVLATAVSELCRNIVRFAGSGELLVELLDEPRPGVRVTARDRGPGIADLEAAMRDGVSTYGGLGLGLPGVRRLMDEFAISSEQGAGTTVTITIWGKDPST